MVVARASGTDLASSLKRNTFLTLGVRPARGPGSARDGGTEKGPGTGGHKRAPGRGDTGPPPDGGTRGQTELPREFGVRQNNKPFRGTAFWLPWGWGTPLP